MSQLARLSREVTRANYKLDRLLEREQPKIRGVFASTAKKRASGDMFKPAASHGSFAEASQCPLLGRDSQLAKALAKYDPDQPRDDQGQWTAAGGAIAAATTPTSGSGGNWQRAAQLSAIAAFGLGAVVAVRTGQAGAAFNVARHGRTMLANAARIKGTKVSRSLLEASAYNLSNVRTRIGLLPYDMQLARRFPGMTTSVRFGRDKASGVSGITISVRSGAATEAAVASGRVPPNVFIGEAVLYESSNLGKVLMVGNLYAPANAAGALFSREFMNTAVRTAIANRVDSIRTFAGSSMGGFLWPQRGFELVSPAGDLGQTMRRTIATRAGQMLDGGAITRGQYDDIAAIVGKWGKDTPTRLAHMNTKVAVGGLKLKDFPELGAIRGDITIGKALLAGTNGFYTLPKAKYEALVTITKRNVAKGYPEYDDTQARDAEGQWTSGGGGAAPSAEASSGSAAAGDKQRSGWLKKIGLTIAVVGGAYIMLRSGRAPLALKPSTLTTPLGRTIPILGHGATRAEAELVRALDMMPAAHFNALKASGLRIAVIKDMGSIHAWMRVPFNRVVKGIYDPTSRILVLPQNVSLFGLSVSNDRLGVIALHEIAHVLDHGRKLSNSSKIAAAITADLAAPAAQGMKTFLNRAYKTPQWNEEVFAQIYSAKYYTGATPTGVLSGKQMFTTLPYTQSELLAAFPRTAAAMDTMKVSVPKLPMFAGLRNRFNQRLDRAIFGDEFVDLVRTPRRGGSLEDWLTRG